MFRRLRLRRLRRRTPDLAVPDLSVPDVVPALTALTTPQLCSLWRKSLAGLRAAPTPGARASVAAARGVLLDELERREPEVMAAWLQSGAREPQGPSAYLVR
ncbi:hypothetical protein [Nocardioides halotolerans]|uniref:hypothetical protein n=1 Tax=Nocardioides halotolerans TaxID=433660 RepID=UPI0012FC264A|nr:hypothetical protein [Nocardioides halotolerans]